MPVSRGSIVVLLTLVGLGACAPQERKTLDDVANGANVTEVGEQVEQQALTVMEPLKPPAPGTPGGLPVDPEPIVEGAIDPASAQGAGQLVQGYYALLEEKRFADAQDLWRDGTPHGDEDPKVFASRFDQFSEIHANIGAPGDPEGAAGSLYVAVPVQIYARVRATGKPYYALRLVTLKRVNDVPGSTAEQRRWHIENIGAWSNMEQAPVKTQ
ncbi:MAG: hypothetical protein V4461_11540 [Pseudomonadota bacterium]